MSIFLINSYITFPDLPPDQIANEKAMSFNGTDQYVNVGSTISLNGELTISIWLNPNDNTIVNLLGNSNNTNFLYINGSTQLQISSSDIAQTFTNTTFSTGSWQHIVLTRDSSNVFRAYKNGTLTDTSSADAGTFTFNQIGTYYTGQYYFNGKMDEIAIFNTALSASKIQQIYDATAIIGGVPQTANLFTGGLDSSLVYWNRMGDS